MSQEQPDRALADAVEVAIGAWVLRCVVRTAMAQLGECSPALHAQADAAARAATAEVGARMRALLATDVDEQRANPLGVLRDAVRYPTAVLAAADVPPVRRDEFARRSFPDDPYDLTPATWSDVDPSLTEPGIVWGAWKAKVVLDRRRSEGRR